MSGTVAGSKKARETNYKLHGKDFYKRIGQKGGQNGKGPNYFGGFASSHAWAVECGRKGGRISRRTKKDDIDRAEEILEKESGRN